MQGRSPSDVVELSMQTLTTFLYQEGCVPAEGIENPTEYLDERFIKTPNGATPQKGNLRESLQQVLNSNIEPGVPVATLLSQATDYETPNSIPAPQEVPPPEPEPIDLENPPWRGVDSIPFDQLQEASPKDVLIEKVASSNDPILKKAVEVVYAIYPASHWGDEACLNLVSSTYEKFKPYIELLLDRSAPPKEVS